MLPRRFEDLENCCGVLVVNKPRERGGGWFCVFRLRGFRKRLGLPVEGTVDELGQRIDRLVVVDVVFPELAIRHLPL